MDKKNAKGYSQNGLIRQKIKDEQNDFMNDSDIEESIEEIECKFNCIEEHEHYFE